MTRFSVRLLGQHSDVVLYFKQHTLEDVVFDLTHQRFIIGNLAEPDEHGLLRKIALQTSRVLSILEEE